MILYWIVTVSFILIVKDGAAKAIVDRQLNERETSSWNFRMVIKYDVYVWECSPSNNDPTEKNTNMSCILDGRWSLNQLTFQLTAIPNTGIKSIDAEYTMKNGEKQLVQFTADSQWAVTVPVDPNWQSGTWNINDKLSFTFDGFNYTFYFGYGPTPHCPRC